MSSWLESTAQRTFAKAVHGLLGLTLGLAATAAGAQGTPYGGIGRTATPQEVAAWDIDVRPDFKGLPKGSGSVSQGQDVWEAKCASCHGVFGESNEFFSPIVGGTSKNDVQTGRVARLTDGSFPGRTTLMKLSSVSTLWDYINRAMPWTQPKSLTADEVYAVTAFILNLGGVVPEGFVLSDQTIEQVQSRLPNRQGKSTLHGLWPGRSMGNAGKPDVKAVACMSGCATAPQVASSIPDYARNAHGNLALQNRPVGAQRGVDTAPVAASNAALVSTAAPTLALAQKHACTACHGTDNRIVGPSFKEITAKYRGQANAEAYLSGKIKAGGQGVWGNIPMPAQALPEADAKALAAWLLAP
jgi:S-disulfanyl-L-cysteine oxidoreductase SoxD